MEFEIIKILVSVAGFVFGGVKEILGASRDEKDRLAALFEKIAVCLESMASDFNNEVKPTGQCEELNNYLADFKSKAEPHFTAEMVDRLEDILQEAKNEKSSALMLANLSGSPDTIMKLKAIAGCFRAQANLLRC